MMVMGLSIFLSLMIIEIFFYLNPNLLPAAIRTEYFLSDDEGGPPGMVIDEDIGYKYLPGTRIDIPFEGHTYSISAVSVGYDEIGFRDDGLNGPLYGIILGDSMAVCVGVELEQCWVEELEQQSRQDFINMGMSGFGPDLQYRMLKKYGLPLQPQKVIWVFFPNDLIQAWRFHQFGQGGVKEGKFWQNPVLSWLANHSTIYLTLAYFWYERNFFKNLYFGRPPIAHNATLAWWLAYTDLSIPEVAEGLARTQAIILEAYQATLAQQSDFVVVVLPFRDQIVYQHSEFAPVFNASTQTIVAFARAHHIPIIDLTQPLSQLTAHSPNTYFFKDSHLTREGNKVVADILTRELAKQMD